MPAGTYNAYRTLSGATDATLSRNEPLARHTTYRVGGPADLYARCNSFRALVYVLGVLREEHVPWVVLGKGSNLLVSDEGFRGCVVSLEGEFRRTLVDHEHNRISAGAGVALPALVNAAFAEGLSGVEYLVGVPGSVGGAIRMNAGLREEWISSVVRDVVVLRPGLGMHRYLASDLVWGYRSCSLSANEIVLETTLALRPAAKEGISEDMERRLARRRRTQPALPSAGSVFRNPEGKSAGQLIESCGLKGYTIGGASISEMHANFIVNNGGASATDILSLIRLAHDRVKEQYGIDLKTEVKFLGFSA